MGAAATANGFTPQADTVWGLGSYDAPALQFNGVDSYGVQWILARVAGWKATTAEVPLQRAAGADGGYFGPGTRAPKVMTLTGAFRVVSGAATTAAVRTALQAAERRLRLALEYLTADQLLWVDGAVPKQMAVRLTGVLDVDDTDPRLWTWSAVVTAADPWKYAAGAAGLVSVTAPLPAGNVNGITFPVGFPADFGGGSGDAGRLVIVNPGDAVYPTVTYTTPTGTLDTPTLTHVGLQQTEGVARLLQPGDRAVLDHGAGSVLLNGSSIYSQRLPGCVFWPLGVGENDLFFTAHAYNAAATVTVTYRPRWS